MLLLLAALSVIPGVQPQFDWTACPVAGEAEIVNPACLAFQPDFLLSASFTTSDTAFERFDRVALAFPGSGFSGYWNDDESIRAFTAGSGMRLFGDMAAFGVGYTWFDPTAASPWEGKSRWTFGFAMRPADWLGIGLVRRGGVTAGGTGYEPRYRGSVALRPHGNLVTLIATADVRADQESVSEEEDNVGELAFSGGAEIRPLPGLSLRFEGSENGFTTGVWTDFGNLGLGGSGSFDDEGAYSGSRGTIRMTSRPRENLTPPRDIFVRIEPGEFAEQQSRSFLGPCAPSFTENALELDRIASDPDVRGVLVDLGSGAGTPAQAEEVRDLLTNIRRTGKPVWIYMPLGGNLEVYLASAGTTIMSHPSGEIGFTGLAAHGIFLRDMLDRIGVYPDLLHIGEFKSASDMLTRSNMSEAQREAETALLKAFQNEMNAAVGEGMGLEAGALTSILRTGPMDPRDAIGMGLISGIAFEDELEADIEDSIGRGVTIQELSSYAASHPVEEEWGPVDHVAVIVATGLIVRGESGSVFPLGRTMGSETIAQLVREASSAPGVRAIVLRIDSGGGDSFASEDMLHSLQQAGERMPVVVSMGAVAGSGGYYIACCGDSIFADNMTVTGSIGVISGKFVFEGLLSRIGVNVETLTDWPMADMGTPFQPYTDAQRQRMEQLVRQSYELFTSRVAEARGMTQPEVDAIGRGRVWAGADALRIGLVDRIGGVVDAVRCAARMAGLDDEWEPVVEVYPEPGMFEGLGLGPFGGLAGTGAQDAVEQLMDLQGTLYVMQPVVID